MGSGLPPLRTLVGADVSGFTGGMGRAVGALSGFKGGTLAAGAAVTGLALGIQKAVSEFADFDAAMTQSTAIMGDLTNEQLAALEQKAIDVSRTNVQSAEEAAEAYFFLASAGLDAEQSVAALQQVADFAQAGMFDMATATDLATDAQSALGLTVDDAAENLQNLTRVTDVLVKANTLANATVEQFSESLTNKLGARLRNLNKPIEEGVAGLAALADQGVKGRLAGRGLNIVFRDLQSQAVRSADAFEELNIQVFDQEGNMRNLADIVEDFEDALGGASDEQKAAKIEMLGINKRAGDFLQTLLGLSGKIREYEKELNRAGGTTRTVAEKQMQTLRKQVGLLGDEFDSLFISTGGAIAPGLTRDVKGLRLGIRLLREEVGEARDAWQDLGTSIEEALGFKVPKLTIEDFGPIGDVIGAWRDLREEIIRTAEARERASQSIFERFPEFAEDRPGFRDVLTGRDEETGLTAREREVRRQRAQAAERVNLVQDARLQMMIEEMGLHNTLLAQKMEELRILQEQDATEEQRLAKAREIAELQRQRDAARREGDVTISTGTAPRHERDRFVSADEGITTEPAEEPPRLPDDVIQGTDELGDLLMNAAVPAIDEFAGQLGIGTGALASFLDSLLTAFGNEFGGEGGALGFLGDVAGAFAGGFQSGGRIPAGRFGIVHPGEMIMTGPANVQPQGGGGKTIVRVENNPTVRIDAVDAQSFERMLRERGGRAVQDMVLGMAGQSEAFSRAILSGSR